MRRGETHWAQTPCMTFMMLHLPLAFDFARLGPLIFSTYYAITHSISGFNRKSVNIFFFSLSLPFSSFSADNFRWIFSWPFRWRFIGFGVWPKWITLLESYWRFAGMSGGFYAGDISNHSLILMPLLFFLLLFLSVSFFPLFRFFSSSVCCLGSCNRWYGTQSRGGVI